MTYTSTQSHSLENTSSEIILIGIIPQRRDSHKDMIANIFQNSLLVHKFHPCTFSGSPNSIVLTEAAKLGL